MPMKPKSMPNRFISELPLPAVLPLHGPIANPIKDVSPEVCILKETKSKVSCLDLGKLAYQMYKKKNVNMVMSNNITHAVEDGEYYAGDQEYYCDNPKQQEQYEQDGSGYEDYYEENLV